MAAAPGDLSGRDLERREARDAVAEVVLVAQADGGGFGVAGLHGETLMGAVQRLDLRIFVHAQHDRVLGRGEVEIDDVVDLGDQLRAGGELEWVRVFTGLTP